MLHRLLLTTLLALAPGALAAQTLSWEPQQVEQAAPVLFTLTLDRPAARVTATWLGKSVAFFAAEDKHFWFALAGPDVEQTPGTYPISVDGAYVGGTPLHITQPMQVAAGSFHSSTLAVANKFIAPSAAEERQLKKDAAAKARAFASSAPQPLWSGSFFPPVASKVFPNYGDNRVFNGKKVSIHRGSDFPARTGTPVHAANAGRVVLAQRLFLEGNCVIVDHGNQLFTIYMHLSQFRVKAGQHVIKGQLLGLSGATGRVTGPHLHLSLRWNGESLNPASLLGMQLPTTGTVETPPATPAKHRPRTR